MQWSTLQIASVDMHYVTRPYAVAAVCVSSLHLHITALGDAYSCLPAKQNLLLTDHNSAHSLISAWLTSQSNVYHEGPVWVLLCSSLAYCQTSVMPVKLTQENAVFLLSRSKELQLQQKTAEKWVWSVYRLLFLRWLIIAYRYSRP